MSRRSYGVMTGRWGWQPLAWEQDGLPTWSWRDAPAGLVTRRQMRERGLAPGGAEPVAQVVCRGGQRRAYLYPQAELVAKRPATPAQWVAVAKAVAARRFCPCCERYADYCIPTSLGTCLDCNATAEADEQASATTQGGGPFRGAGDAPDGSAAASVARARAALDWLRQRQAERDTRTGMTTAAPVPDRDLSTASSTPDVREAVA